MHLPIYHQTIYHHFQVSQMFYLEEKSEEKQGDAIVLINI